MRKNFAARLTALTMGGILMLSALAGCGSSGSGGGASEAAAPAQAESGTEAKAESGGGSEEEVSGPGCRIFRFQLFHQGIQKIYRNDSKPVEERKRRRKLTRHFLQYGEHVLSFLYSRIFSIMAITEKEQ